MWYSALSILGILALSNMHAEDLNQSNPEIAVVIVPQHPPNNRMEHAPRSPGPGHFWIRGHWQWNNSQWQWVAGRWERQPRPGMVWRNGRWTQTMEGWFWTPGEWR